MASGFILLSDGRCYAPRWVYYDMLLAALAVELDRTPEEVALGEWLLSLIPTPQDIQHLGYGPWVRVSDDVVVKRWLDLRELSPSDQRRFAEAVQRTFARLKLGGDSTLPDYFQSYLQHFLRMLKFSRQRRPLRELSSWRDDYTLPPTGNRVGPGWDTEPEA